jgi:hypothetical protein
MTNRRYEYGQRSGQHGNAQLDCSALPVVRAHVSALVICETSHEVLCVCAIQKKSKMSCEEIAQWVKDYPFVDLDRTRALIRKTLNETGDQLARDTQETRWCVRRNGHDVTIREGEMVVPEKWALAIEWTAYAERMTELVERMERNLFK